MLVFAYFNLTFLALKKFIIVFFMMFLISGHPSSRTKHGYTKLGTFRKMNTHSMDNSLLNKYKYLTTNNRITSVICHIICQLVKNEIYSTKEPKQWVKLQSIFHFSIGEFTFYEDRRHLKTENLDFFQVFIKHFPPKFELI